MEQRSSIYSWVYIDAAEYDVVADGQGLVSIYSGVFTIGRIGRWPPLWKFVFLFFAILWTPQLAAYFMNKLFYILVF